MVLAGLTEEMDRRFRPMPHTFGGAGLLPCEPSFRSALLTCKLQPNRRIRPCSSIPHAGRMRLSQLAGYFG